MPKTDQQKTATLNVRLPVPLKETLETLGAERGMNLSEVVRYAAMFYVDYTRRS